MSMELTFDNRDVQQVEGYLRDRIKVLEAATADSRVDALQRALKLEYEGRVAAEIQRDQYKQENAALRLELADARAAMHDGLMTFLVGDGRRL